MSILSYNLTKEKCIILIISCIIFIGSISTMIYMFIKDDVNEHHLIVGYCNVTFCEIKQTTNSVNFTYQWEIFPYYNASIITNELKFCLRSIRCGYDDRCPELTFGGWLSNRIGGCINGTCKLQIYPFIIGMMLIVPMFFSGVAIISILIDVHCFRRNEYEEL